MRDKVLKAAVLDGYSRRKDRSVSIRFHTQELTSADIMEIDAMCDSFGILYFRPGEKANRDELAEIDKVDLLNPLYETPMRYDEFESRTPASISVITREEIENSGAQTTIDLFRSEPGIVVRDWTGNGTSAQVDIRGFGEQGGMNVAVMVDSRRVNEIDLSAVDWTQIPIDRIERIEIIRGGAGAVLYGDNASSGVINIITTSGEGRPYVEYEQKIASYDTDGERVSIGGLTKGLSFLVTALRKGTHGYRDNSYFDNMELSSRLNYEVDSDFHLSALFRNIRLELICLPKRNHEELQASLFEVIDFAVIIPFSLFERIIRENTGIIDIMLRSVKFESYSDAFVVTVNVHLVTPIISQPFRFFCGKWLPC